MQDEGHGGEVRFEFYRCSRDGEPSHNVPLPETFPDFEAKTRVGRDLKGWLAARPIGATRAPN
jgi:hypothetical protein